MTDGIGAYIQALVNDRNRVLREVCEAAAHNGHCGVRIVRNPDGSETIEPHESVPSGTVHEFPYGTPVVADSPTETR